MSTAEGQPEDIAATTTALNAHGNSSSNNLFFMKLKKYNGDLSEDLSTWLREFERCCLIAHKTDMLVKGQYLMLCVGGRAKAVLDDYETELGAAQNFDALVTKLTDTFDSTTSRETKMTMFEERRQQIGETEEEFMLQLLRLYKNANPTASTVAMNLALKRKLLQGVSPSLKKNIFLYCSTHIPKLYLVNNYYLHLVKQKI